MATTPASTLEEIVVTGEPPQKPTVRVPAPWGVDETRSKTLGGCDNGGAPVGPNSTVVARYVVVNARTGQAFEENFTRGEPLEFVLASVIPGFQKGMQGKHKGCRGLVAVPGKDGYDATGGSPQAGVLLGDTLVFVVDIVEVR